MLKATGLVGVCLLLCCVAQAQFVTSQATRSAPVTAVQASAAAPKTAPVPAEKGQEATVAAKGVQVTNAKTELSLASGLIQRRQYEVVRDILTPLMDSEDPDVKWPATLWVAKAYQGEKRMAKALPIYRQIMKDNKALEAQCRYQLGLAEAADRHYKSAHEQYEQAYRVATEDFKPTCLYQAAYTHYTETHYGRATELLERLLKDYPKSSLVRTAEGLLKQSKARLKAARQVDVGWVANVGMTPTSQLIQTINDYTLTADAQAGVRLRWSPRDGTQALATAYVTRTNYLSGDTDNRQGLTSGLTLTHDLGDLRTLQYGLSYTDRERVTVVNSDQVTLGVWSSFATPVGSDGRLSLSLNVSDLRYPSKVTSGTQTTVAGSYSEPLSPTMSLSVSASGTNSVVGARYLSYSGPSMSGTLSNRFSPRDRAVIGASYTGHDYDAPRPRQKVAREEIVRRYFGEFTRRVTSRVSITVGWQENKTTSNFHKTDHTESSVYVRFTNLFELKVWGLDLSASPFTLNVKQ
jgi:TolA-binding protein